MGNSLLLSLIPLLIQLVALYSHVLAQQGDVSAKHINKIALGSTLLATTNPNNSKWLSSSAEFAFGFYEISPKLYLVGIWFDKIQERTLVWTPNRDGPVGEGCKLDFTKSGDLSLFDSQGNLKWSVISSRLNGTVDGGAMLDNGNFVLMDSSSETLWQSFDSPTDTLLAGQTLNWKGALTSRATDGNYSSGRFKLILQDVGNLVLYPLEWYGQPQGAYWASGTWTSGTNPMRLIVSQDGLLTLVNGTNATVEIVNDKTGEGQHFHRVTLESDGVLREYARNRDDKNSWSVSWQVPDDPCDVKGSCGLNGFCTRNEDNSRDCECPPGFNFIDNEDPPKGCSRNASIGCSLNSNMVRLEHTHWRADAHYAFFATTNETECKQACLDDCQCVVVSFGAGYCLKKANPLQHGRQAADVDKIAFVKVSSDDGYLRPTTSPPDKNDRSRPFFGCTIDKKDRSRPFFVAGLCLLGSFAISVSALLVFSAFCRRIVKSGSSGGLECFTYKEIYAATRGFKEQLGEGAFGTVYKGVLSDGRPIAVKKIKKVLQDGEKEFRTEMAIIGTTHHKNLVQLFGFCDERSERLLVYEHMPNGSLDAALFRHNNFLDWNLRVQIALGSARGIAYLHEECRNQIIHCDIKPQNVLLDQAYNPNISDFGLAKLMGIDQTGTFTTARGTRGYWAPEWHKNTAITTKVDVYSFGIMLLEIICCRKNLQLDAPETEIVLSDFVYECFRFGRLAKLVQQQQSEDTEIEGRQLERMVLVGLWCIQEDPSLRPSMKKVVQMLEGTIEIAVPPPPSSLSES